MIKYDDITGNRYGRLVAIRRAGKKWEFRCDCGHTKEILATNAKRGHTQSCGCFHKENSAKVGRSTVKHGYAGSSEYDAWSGMHQRCGNPKDKDYGKYGGRGIKVCERWSKFDRFIEDMGDKPTKRHSLDRIDVNGDYAPENCRWATTKVQNGNKRCNIRVSAFGKSGCLADFISYHSPHYHMAQILIRKGIEPSQAVIDVIGTSC
jgi:hypothetical protein